jgi:phosphomevalonate kinase
MSFRGHAAQHFAACGKAFLAGEYGVLEPGEPALVLGLDRALHLTVRPAPGRRVELRHGPSKAIARGELGAGIAWSGAVPVQLRFAARAASIAARLCAEEEREPHGFQATFEDDLALAGRKLGLGGSAAASVLSVRATCAAQGRQLSPEDAAVLAASAHRAEQGGQGSGADVAASALGGLLEVRAHWRGEVEPRELLAQKPLEIRRVAVPPELHFLLAFTGAAADTRTLVSGALEFARERPSRWRHHVRAISTRETALREAIEIAIPNAVLDAVRLAAAAMEALGVEAGVPIVTQELQRACAIAAAAGAAAKPSGAGGGDCAVVLGFGDAVSRAERALAVAGFNTLRVGPG